MQKTITFTKGKKKREELHLPILHYIVADDWIDKLGHEVFTTWLKFHTWCDRSDERKDKDNDVIPYSLNAVAEKLGVSRPKLYRLIKPLWNYGLIDLQEYEDSKSKANKPVNIIVYDYPQNDKSLECKPLEKVRDYDTDYNSEAKIFAKTGGRPKEKKNPDSDGYKTETTNKRSDGYKTETIMVTKLKPSMVTPVLHNNVSNSITNDSNIYTNDSNDNPYHYLSDYIFNSVLPMRLKKYFEKQIKILVDYPSFDLRKVEYFYNTFNEYVQPDCTRDNPSFLNELEFCYTMEKMFEAMIKNKEPIKNMEGLIKKWVLDGISYKKDRVYNAMQEMKMSEPDNSRQKPDFRSDINQYSFCENQEKDDLPF